MDRESVVVLTWPGVAVALELWVMLWRRSASMWSLAVAVVMSVLLLAYAGFVRGMNIGLLAVGAAAVNVALYLVLRSLQRLEKKSASPS